MTENGTTHPPVLWAQRNDTVLLTISVNDLHNEKYAVNDKTLSFYGEGSENLQKYKFELQFYREIVPQESRHSKTARGLFFVLKKKEAGPYWPRLLEGTKKAAYIKTDFNRWKDESDSDSDNSLEHDSSLQSMMQQMGGLGGGLGGGGGAADLPSMDGAVTDSSDSDDEPVPGLET